MIYYIKF